MDGGSRRSRRSSPERAKICGMHHQQVKSLKQVQVVYYLSRNGVLEHPHSMEVTLAPCEPLRLRHVLDRLIALRGSGLPSLYSWSCKRSYKGGYVWYDLGVNDIIHPTDAAEYVLKGSKLLRGCSERFQQLQLSHRQVLYQGSNLNLKRKTFRTSPRRETEEYEEQRDEVYEDGEKTSNTNSTTKPRPRCSRGVSTDELEGRHETRKVIANDMSLTISSTSKATPPDKNEANDSSGRLLDGGTSGSAASRNSVLLQLIACGSSAVAKAPCMSNMVKKNDIVEKMAVRKSAEKLSETEMMRCMPENPRFGNSQSEEKEHFSGSLVESMKAHWDASKTHAVLKKSNSHNEERSDDRVEEEEEEKKRGVKAKCMPRKKCSGSSK